MLPLILFMLTALSMATDRLFVVQRERSSVSVVEEGRVIGELRGLGDMRHAVIKFSGSRAYILSRDGRLTLFDPMSLRVEAQVNVGESSVGFAFCGENIAIANYDPPSVVLVDRSLRLKRVLSTGSRAVGIKGMNGLLFYLLMDSGAIEVARCGNLKPVKRIEGAGRVPFDALLAGNLYVAGFFGESSLGVLDVRNLSYRKVRLSEAGGVPLKVPHFGLWGVDGSIAYIPAVGDGRIYKLDLSTGQILGSLEVPGDPVFVVLSPDRRWMAVNYSGQKEDLITLIERHSGSIYKTVVAGRRITHLRFSEDGRKLYVSSYYENRLRALSVPDVKVLWEVSVPTPSGIFLWER